MHSIRKSISIALTEDNLTSATITIFNNLQNSLNSIEKHDGIHFDNLHSLLISACIQKQKQFNQPQYIDKFTFNPNPKPTSVAVQTQMRTEIGSKRKLTSLDKDREDEEALFIPRNSEIARGITSESHPFLNNLAIKQSSNEEKVSWL